jgi:hypothetical protein
LEKEKEQLKQTHKEIIIAIENQVLWTIKCFKSLLTSLALKG